MKLKFERGERFTIKNEKEIIAVTRKNFVTKEIIYVMESGNEFTEKELLNLQSVKEEKGTSEIKPEKEEKTKVNTLHFEKKKYKELYGKNVPKNKTNDLDWIQKKNLEKSIEKDFKFEAISKLSEEQLVQLIYDKELDIDEADYEGKEDLLIAICEELEIEIPTE